MHRTQPCTRGKSQCLTTDRDTVIHSSSLSTTTNVLTVTVQDIAKYGSVLGLCVAYSIKMWTVLLYHFGLFCRNFSSCSIFFVYSYTSRPVNLLLTPICNNFVFTLFLKNTTLTWHPTTWKYINYFDCWKKCCMLSNMPPHLSNISALYERVCVRACMCVYVPYLLIYPTDNTFSNVRMFTY